MANGTSVHGFELDDVGAGGHNGSVTVTSALALAQAGLPVSGSQLIRAIATGIEVAARVEACCNDIPRTHMGFHGPGLWGVFASMATCATLMSLSTEECVYAIGTAAQQAASLMGTQGGGMGKRMLAGKAAHSGVLAAQLAQHGFTNVNNIFECGYGSFPSAFCGGRQDFKLDELDKGFGEVWLTRGVNFKLWACRVPIHPSLEAIKAIRQEARLTRPASRKLSLGFPWARIAPWAFPIAQRPSLRRNLISSIALPSCCSKMTSSSISLLMRRSPHRRFCRWSTESRSYMTGVGPRVG